MFRSLSVVIPVYNEEDRVVATFTDIFAKVIKYTKDFEIILSDDGSQDKTVNLVKNKFNSEYQSGILKIISLPHRGKGAAVRAGVLAAVKDWILFMDADNSTNIDSLGRFVPYINDYKMIIGSRALVDNTIVRREYLYRKVIGLVHNYIARVLLKIEIFDTQCGFKLFERDAAQGIFRDLKEDGFSFDVEFAYLARQRGFSIKEVAIEWSNSARSSVRIFRDGLIMFIALWRIKFRHRLLWRKNRVNSAHFFHNEERD